MEGASYLWWIPALPLLGSVACGALHLIALRARRAGRADLSGLAAWIAVLAMAAAFAVSVAGFALLAGLEPGARVLESSAWDWIRAGALEVRVSMLLDPLSSVMALVVTGVGLLIHVYAAGYMKGDPGYAKFFAFLNLFVFAMLMLVLSSSLLGLFIGWEGVGLCSYLLIGFWYQKEGPSEAGQKAFVMNRVGDACFLAGSFLLVRAFGTLDLAEIGAGVPALLAAEGSGTLALAALLLFLGACGKSAQFPLFTWLPDAMAGPTPVSALIHAATMVTSGIYLVVRLNPLYAAAPGVLFLIGVVAAGTAFLAGTAALAQRDIKKVLAYSTVSQLGYMFLALSVGAFAGAIFHLVTHAFFKALLFLGAGSVIHGMNGEQDMHRMGGLARHMPRTALTFAVGAAALSGLPLLSGFFSKDEILAATFAAGGAHYLLWILATATAAITAYYTWRMVALTFHGKERFDAAELHPHESPRIMTLPLAILALLAASGGILGLPHLFGLRPLERWLEPVVRGGHEILFAGRGGAPSHLSVPVELLLLVLGATLAIWFSRRGFRNHVEGPRADEELARARPALQGRLADAWGIDRAYTFWIVQPVKLAAFAIAVLIDQFALDGIVNGVGQLAREAGRRLRRLADGTIASYGLWMGAAAALIALAWLWGGTR